MVVNNDVNLKTKCNILSGFYQNGPCLKSILSNIRFNIISLYHYDYFVLTKSWLINDINSNELGASNFKVYSYDRNNLISFYSRGGRILIVINNCYYSNAITLFDPTLECLAISFKSGNFKIMLVSIYIPPNSLKLKSTNATA